MTANPTAPAAMPTREQVEAEIRPMTYDGADLTECVERVFDLFAPILAEKERRDAIDREQAETARFLQHHLDNPQPPSDALRNLWADYKAAGIESVGFDNPLNACCYSEQCKALEARALAAETDSEHWQSLFESTRASMQQDINRLEKERDMFRRARNIAESALAELRMQMLADEGQSGKAVAAERERCAQIAERTYARDALHFELGTAIAAAIRAQGE